MAYLTSAVGELLSWLLAMFGGIFSNFFTVDFPLALFFILIPLVGLGVGLFKRLLNL